MGNTIRENLIIENINLVYHVLKQMRLYHKYDEYYDIGVIGLVKAANRFDESKGYTFTTYAGRCIRNEILMYIRKNHFTAISLDTPIAKDDINELLLIEVIPDDFNMEKYILKQEELEAIHRAISELEPEERKLLHLKYNDDIKMTQTDLAKMFNTSQAVICRRLQHIIAKLQRIVKSYGFDI